MPVEVANRGRSATLCGLCGYELGCGFLRVCPECGGDPSAWSAKSDRPLRRVRIAHHVAASLPVLYMIVSSAAFVLANASRGVRLGPMDHPHGGGALLTVCVMLVPLVFPLALVGPGILWLLAAERLVRIAPSLHAYASSLLRMVSICLAWWVLGAAAVYLDPAGAFEWMMD
jgi:hypothetical protein